MITFFCVIWQVMELHLLHLMELEQKAMVRQFSVKLKTIINTHFWYKLKMFFSKNSITAQIQLLEE